MNKKFLLLFLLSLSLLYCFASSKALYLSTAIDEIAKNITNFEEADSQALLLGLKSNTQQMSNYLMEKILSSLNRCAKEKSIVYNEIDIPQNVYDSDLTNQVNIEVIVEFAKENSIKYVIYGSIINFGSLYRLRCNVLDIDNTNKISSFAYDVFKDEKTASLLDDVSSISQEIEQNSINQTIVESEDYNDNEPTYVSNKIESYPKELPTEKKVRKEEKKERKVEEDILCLGIRGGATYAKTTPNYFLERAFIIMSENSNSTISITDRMDPNFSAYFKLRSKSGFGLQIDCFIVKTGLDYCFDTTNQCYSMETTFLEVPLSLTYDLAIGRTYLTVLAGIGLSKPLYDLEFTDGSGHVEIENNSFITFGAAYFIPFTKSSGITLDYRYNLDIDDFSCEEYGSLFKRECHYVSVGYEFFF